MSDINRDYNVNYNLLMYPKNTKLVWKAYENEHIFILPPCNNEIHYPMIYERIIEIAWVVGMKD